MHFLQLEPPDLHLSVAKSLSMHKFSGDWLPENPDVLCGWLLNVDEEEEDLVNVVEGDLEKVDDPDGEKLLVLLPPDWTKLEEGLENDDELKSIEEIEHFFQTFFFVFIFNSKYYVLYISIHKEGRKKEKKIQHNC